MPLMPAPPQLVFSDLKSWIEDLLEDAGSLVASDFPDLHEGPYVHEMPDEICTITLTAGTGWQMEGAADAPTFQTRIRSGQNHQLSGETNALLLDKLIFMAQFPTKLVSGLNLLLVSRVGGGPAAIGPPDDAFRYDYVCNYYAIVGAP